MIIKGADFMILSNSLKGINREINQDDTLIIEDPCFYLLVLFDGVSSLRNSIFFIQECKAFLQKEYKTYLKKNEIFLRELFFECNKQASLKVKDGKTTCSALYMEKDTNKAVVFNIGDSRIYDFSNQYLQAITIDDSLPGNRNVITKCLGMEGLSYSDLYQKEIEYGYGLLLCSDGFYKNLEENKNKYFLFLQYKYPGNVFKALNKAQIGNNLDDSTFIIIRKNEF